MKNKMLLSLLVCAALGSGKTIAQNSYREKIEFNYEQLPVFPISSDKSYNRTLINTFAEDIEIEKAAIVAENERLKKEAADDKKAYQEKSVGEKMLSKVVLGESKPTGRAQTLEQPFYPKVWDEQSVLASYASIPGMTVSPNAKAQIKIFVERFSFTVDFQQTEKGYYYRVNVGLPVRLEVYDEKGTQVSSNTFEVSQVGKSNDFQSEFFDSEQKRDNHWKINQQGKLRSLEATRFDINMKKVQSYLVENIGYNKEVRKTSIGMVKDKSNTVYTDINALFPEMVEAYNKVITKNQSNYEPTLTKAIGVWQNELKELDPNAKKARINTEVGQDLYLNIAEAYIWLNKFDEAQQILIKYKVLDPKGKDKWYKNINELFEDQKKRYEANKI